MRRKLFISLGVGIAGAETFGDRDEVVPIPGLREVAVDHVGEGVYHLGVVLADYRRGRIDLLEHVGDCWGVEGNHALPQSGRVSGVEGSVPLPVLLPKPDDHDVGVLD